MRKYFAVGLALVFVLAGCGKKAEETKAVEAPGQPAVPGVTVEMMTAVNQFGEALGKKDYASAYQSLRALLMDFWGTSPLILQNVKFVKNDSNTFGIYEPKANDEYAAGEPMYLYMEPAGYAVKKNDLGKYEFGFNADMSLENEKGEILGGQKGFANMEFSSWNFNTEICLTFTYTYSGLEKGRYKMVTTVHDARSDKAVTIENWFSVI
jgi:hypothetical protein